MSGAGPLLARLVSCCRLSEDDMKGMIEEADRDGDGLVSRDEFIAVMQRTALFN